MNATGEKMKIGTAEHAGRLEALLLFTVCLELLILLQRAGVCTACSHDNHRATFNHYRQSSDSFGPPERADSQLLVSVSLPAARNSNWECLKWSGDGGHDCCCVQAAEEKLDGSGTITVILLSKFGVNSFGLVFLPLSAGRDWKSAFRPLL